VLFKHKMLQCNKLSPNILQYRIPHYDAVETQGFDTRCLPHEWSFWELSLVG